ncbi:hypothetical protein CAPTEDRAFT_120430 [Capitella teleta]|uniref:BTB domain-containing protein n=1 Tax=Capitella teleta TaxID=283909 RepID=R7TMN6_CAPTE|nr:hypothetical protein CAPTEDRAFT_120430 [Capitella teleta]|eukprot:ELT95138.1 hypothetical protein CAPTEDRAFT_120430 [Capitella teleta]
MKEAGELLDVTLVFGECRIRCHKVILAGMCDFFRRMFTTNMAECGAQEIVMRDISAGTGTLLVGYLYTGQIEINTQNVQDLLAASEMLMLGALKQNVEEFLRSHTESMNCISMINLARFYSLETLLAKAKDILHDHIKEIIDMDELRYLQERDFVEVLEERESQEESFLFIQKWMRSADGRTDRFNDLLQHIDLSLCSKEFIFSTVMDEELMHNSRGMKMLQLLFQSFGSTDAQPKSLAVGKLEGEMWMCRDIHVQDWYPIQKPPSQHMYYSACASPGGFIVSGGSRNNVPQRDCFSYDSKSDSWSTLPSMSTARRSHSSIYYNQHLYIVGGWDGQKKINIVETLNMRSLQWSHLPPLPHPVGLPYLAIISNKFLVFGVRNGSWNVDMHEFDFAQQTWQTRSPMPEICDAGSAVTLGEEIYVIGGRSNSCMRFNPRADAWTFLQRPPMDHTNCSLLVWKGQILVFGADNHDSIEAYSPKTNTWTKWALKTPARGGIRFAFEMKLPE